MYIIPANTNNGKLIFNLFLPIDLIIAVSGVAVTLLALLIVQPHRLCVPVPNYHNIRTVIKECFNFFYHRRNYKWEGWCYLDEFKG